MNPHENNLIALIYEVASKDVEETIYFSPFYISVKTNLYGTV